MSDKPRMKPAERMKIARVEMPQQDPCARSARFTEVNLGLPEQVAKIEAERCLQCKKAKCVPGCPVGVDVPAFVAKIAEGDFRGAADIMYRDNLLPGITGRVCPQETQCEQACVRGNKHGAPVAIGYLERFIADWARENPDDRPRPAVAPSGKRAAIVGAGPAGLTAAGVLARLGHDVTIFEALHEPGGVLLYGIPEFRLPKEIVRHEVETLRALGVKIETNVVIGRTCTIDELLRDEGFNAVFIANGAGLPILMGIPGEQLKGVYSANEFLTRVNLMHGYEDHAETPVLVREHMVVVGGGNTAMDCARSAVRLGAEVTVLYRRGRAEMPANAEEVEAAVCEGVKFEFLAAPDAILGDPRRLSCEPLDGVEASFDETRDGAGDLRVTGVRCVRMALGEPDASGRRRPEPVPGSCFAVDADTVLTALGEEADLGFLPEELAAAGHIRAGTMGGTRRGMVFIGGDLLDTPHTIAFALGSGKRAAIGIDHTLRSLAGDDVDALGALDVGALRFGPDGNVSATRWRGDDPVRRADPVNEVVGPDEINTVHFRREPWHHDRFMPADRTRRTFAEANHGLSYDAAMAEAQRCFNCAVCNGCEVCLVFCPDVAISRGEDGRLVIDYAHCKGCGICAAECPRGAITMTREGL